MSAVTTLTLTEFLSHCTTTLVARQDSCRGDGLQHNARHAAASEPQHALAEWGPEVGKPGAEVPVLSSAAAGSRAAPAWRPSEGRVQLGQKRCDVLRRRVDVLGRG